MSKKLTQQKVFKLFAKPKQLLRKSDVRALEALVEAMGAALDPITIRDV